MEVLKGNGRDCASHPGGDRFAGVSHEVFDGEKLRGLLLVLLVNSEIPVIAESELQFGMITCLNDDLVGHEVRSQAERESLDQVLGFRLTAREVEDGELLIRPEHHEIRAKDNSGPSLFIIVELYGRVVGRLERDDSGFFPFVARVNSLSVDEFPAAIGLGGHIGRSTSCSLNKKFDLLWEMLLPEGLMCFQEVGLGFDFANFSGLVVPDIDSLVSIKWDSPPLLEYLHLNASNVLPWALHDPFLPCDAVSALVIVILGGLEQKGFLFSEDLNRVDTR